MTFNPKEELAHSSRDSYLTRTYIQYHWQNNGSTPSMTLMEPRQSKRKSIRQEERMRRRTACEVRG